MRKVPILFHRKGLHARRKVVHRIVRNLRLVKLVLLNWRQWVDLFADGHPDGGDFLL